MAKQVKVDSRPAVEIFTELYGVEEGARLAKAVIDGPAPNAAENFLQRIRGDMQSMFDNMSDIESVSDGKFPWARLTEARRQEALEGYKKLSGEIKTAIKTIIEEAPEEFWSHPVWRAWPDLYPAESSYAGRPGLLLTYAHTAFHQDAPPARPRSDAARMAVFDKLCETVTKHYPGGHSQKMWMFPFTVVLQRRHDLESMRKHLRIMADNGGPAMMGAMLDVLIMQEHNRHYSDISPPFSGPDPVEAIQDALQSRLKPDAKPIDRYAPSEVLGTWDEGKEQGLPTLAEIASLPPSLVEQALRANEERFDASGRCYKNALMEDQYATLVDHMAKRIQEKRLANQRNMG